MKTYCIWTLTAVLSFGGLAPAVVAVDTRGSGGLIISEVVDATLPGGLPKFIELTNCGAGNIDLSQYSIGNYNNGGTALGGNASTILSGTLTPGESYVVSYENNDAPGTGTFFDTYGVDPDNLDLGAFFNGDDVLALFLGQGTGDGSDATLVDIYGVLGVDGSNQTWEYTDSYVTRSAAATPNPTFTESEWTIAGVDALEDAGGDTVELALIQAETTPGVHTCFGAATAVPAVGNLGKAATAGFVFLMIGVALGTRRIFG